MTLLALVAAALIAATLVGVRAYLLTSDAMAHDVSPSATHPQGWSYPSLVGPGTIAEKSLTAMERSPKDMSSRRWAN
ncbi:MULTISPECIES: hypothetical protein [unclassified Mesorhizobium]|uniref:hypothetical protein n=1 Tax=unclassified Mesorhizobium TaxID=325217 RepID=UPI000422ACF2|nr:MULTISPECIES: hypothetical protein [unclassified Mesorhizobium]